MAVSYGIVVGVIVINQIITLIVNALSLFERHESNTAISNNKAIKLTLVLWLNSSVSYSFVHQNAPQWFDNGDLVYDVVSILIFLLLNPFITMGTYIVFAWMRGCKRCCEQSKGDESTMTQAEANALYEGGHLDIENNIAGLMNLILSCLWYSPVVPIAIPVAAIGAFLNLFITKYMIVNWYKKPENYGIKLVTVFADLIPYFTVMWAGGMIYFFGQSRYSYSVVNVARS